MKDGFNREIEYARISVTDRCQLRCRYCMGEKGIEKKAHSDILSIEQFYNIVDALISLGIKKFRITGGEPLVRKGVMPLIEYIGKTGKELSVTTNGMNLEEYALPLKNVGVKQINISLDTLDKEKYFYITRGGNLETTLNGIKKAVDTGFEEIKLNTVVMKGINDTEIDSLINFAVNSGILIRFIELMPFKCQQEFFDEHFIALDEILNKLSNFVAVDTYHGSPAKYYTDGKIRIGMIKPLSDCFCSCCNRIRITADGKLLNCLHSDTSYDLKPYLADNTALREFIFNCVQDKPQRHQLAEGIYQSLDMFRIGG